MPKSPAIVGKAMFTMAESRTHIAIVIQIAKADH
jgi:hypothetical protein